MIRFISSKPPGPPRALLCLLICLALIFLVPPVSRGGVEGSGSGQDRKILFSLESTIEYALSHRPGISSAQSSLSSSQAGLTVARSAHRPSIGLSGNLTKTLMNRGQQVVNDILVESSQYTTDYYSLAVNLTVPMFMEGGFVFGTLPSEKVAADDVQTKQQELQLARQETIYEITDAFFSALKAHQDVSVAEGSLKVYEMLLEEAKAQFERDLITNSSLFSAEVLVSQARKDLNLARNTELLMMQNLAIAMGIDSADSIRLDDTVPPVPALPPVLDLIALAQARRQEIVVQENAVRSARDTLDLSKSERYPTADVSTVYRLSDDFHPPVLAQDWRVIFSVNVPVFDFGGNRAKILQSTYDLRAAQETLSEVKLSVIQEIVQNYSTVQGQMESRRILELQIQQARDALKTSQEKFAKQLVPRSSVMSAEQELLTARVALIKADYDAQVQIALLRKSVGGSLAP
jgi:outer membrane protein